jgi:hypothetical protein
MLARVTTVPHEALDPLRVPPEAHQCIGLVDRTSGRVRLITLLDGVGAPTNPADEPNPEALTWPDSLRYDVVLAEYDDRATAATVTTVDAEETTLGHAIAFTRTELLPRIRATSSCLGLLVLVDQVRRDVLTLAFWSTAEPQSPTTLRHEVVFGRVT